MDFNKQMPDWKNKGDEPSDELKANGFLAGNKPPANIFNWFWGLTSDAIKELQQKLTDEETTRIEADKNINAVKLSGYEHLAFQKITSNYYVPPKNADGVPDWNCITTSGYYGLVKASSVSGHLNSPDSNNGFFPLVLAYGDSSLTQIAFAFESSETYIRRCVYGKWTDWTVLGEGCNAQTVGKVEKNFTVKKGSWFKFAKCKNALASGVFVLEVGSNGGGCASISTFSVSQAYSLVDTNQNKITPISHSYFGSCVSKIRLDTKYGNDIEQYIDFYIENGTDDSTGYAKIQFLGQGWEICDIESNNVITDYTSQEITL